MTIMQSVLTSFLLWEMNFYSDSLANMYFLYCYVITCFRRERFQKLKSPTVKQNFLTSQPFLHSSNSFSQDSRIYVARKKQEGTYLLLIDITWQFGRLGNKGSLQWVQNCLSLCLQSTKVSC